jgi:hypothetical protein
MTEQEWAESLEAARMMTALGGQTTARKRLLFGCAYVRLWITGEGKRHADLLDSVDTTERHADGEVGEEEYRGATQLSKATATGLPPRDSSPFISHDDRADRRDMILWLRNPWAAARADPEPVLCRVLRDVFHPFKRRLPADHRTWDGGTLIRLAENAYRERVLPYGLIDPAHLAVLSDALEEAGCTDTNILAHLRSPGPHVRGCWALDLILGKS